MGSVRLPDAFAGKKDDDEAAKELKRGEEAKVDAEKKRKLAERWTQREETAVPLTLTLLTLMNPNPIA